MSKHTKTPWHVGMKPGPAVYGPQGEQVIMAHNPLIDYQENTANLAHIVKCVNAHEELVNTLADVNALFNYHYSIGNDDEAGNAIHERVRNLLAKVKGV